MFMVFLKFEYPVWVGKANSMLIFLPCNHPIPMGAHQLFLQGWCPVECELGLIPQCDGITVGRHDCIVVIDDLPEVSVLVKEDTFPQSIRESRSLPSSLETAEGSFDVTKVDVLEQLGLFCIGEEIPIVPWRPATQVVPVPPISCVMVPVDISQSFEWGSGSIIIGFTHMLHSTGCWVSSNPSRNSGSLGNNLLPSICSRRVDWMFWPCHIPILPSPRDGTSPVEGSFFHPLNVLVPGSISLGVIELRGSFKNFVDLFDHVWGRDQLPCVFLKNSLEAPNGGIFANGVRIWVRSFGAR